MPKTITFDRESIVRKAMNAFWKKGYHGTSMQDLVDATGLNRSSIYNSFGDKFSLFLESMKYYQEQEQSRAFSLLFKSNSAIESIRSLFMALIDANDLNNDKKGCYLVNCTAELSATDQQVHKFLSDNQDLLRRAFTDIIKVGQQQGEISSDKDAGQLALYLFSSLQGLRLTGMLVSSEKELQGIVQQVISSLK